MVTTLFPQKRVTFLSQYIVDAWITSRISKFTDDTKMGRVIEAESDRERLQEDLDRLRELSQKWQMSFNAEKCKVLRL